MSEPIRIQRKRTRGWRMPEHTVCVTRPGKFGNPYVVGEDGDASECVALYRSHFWNKDGRWRFDAGGLDIYELSGKNLACWCPIGTPCHADVLLELANSHPYPPSRLRDESYPTDAL
jgi:hypothetical protein